MAIMASVSSVASAPKSNEKRSMKAWREKAKIMA